MIRPYDSVLMIAYGGPDCMDDVRPFIENVVRGKRVPQERIEQVIEQYRVIGGRSPLNELIRDQARRLEDSLRQGGLPLPVHVGMRHWPPFLADTVRRMAENKQRRAIGVICSIQQCDTSWQQYQRDVAAARDAVGAEAPDVDFINGWYDHPLLIEAAADQVRAALDQLPEHLRDGAGLVFTAHSIPVTEPGADTYAAQLRAAALAVAERLHRSDWRIAYQSRSGRPADPWLEPDVRTVLAELGKSGRRAVVAMPLGFVCDHVEVLFDLDVLARQAADVAGIAFARARTVGTHPGYVRMLSGLIAERCRSDLEEGMRERRRAPAEGGARKDSRTSGRTGSRHEREADQP